MRDRDLALLLDLLHQPSGKRLYAQVADDLVGVFAIVRTAIHTHRARGKARASFAGLLTRAEEVGFVGAVGHFALGWLARASRPIVCVSLETSRTLANAVIGKGPVVRLGDRRTVFDPNALNVLTHVAQRELPQRHQRCVMDGGACEATAATAFGLTAIGISVPLGNYHNQGFEGGPDCRGPKSLLQKSRPGTFATRSRGACPRSLPKFQPLACLKFRRATSLWRTGFVLQQTPNAPAPEFVHLDDVDGLLKLCRGLLRPRLPWHAPWETEQRRYRKLLRDYGKLI